MINTNGWFPPYGSGGNGAFCKIAHMFRVHCMTYRIMSSTITEAMIAMVVESTAADGMIYGAT